MKRKPSETGSVQHSATQFANKTAEPNEWSELKRQLAAYQATAFDLPDSQLWFYSTEIKAAEPTLRLEMMRSVAPSLLLVGIKQEETTPPESHEVKPYRATDSVRPSRPRQCRRSFPEYESAPSESDWESSGDEWQPSHSPASSRLSNKTKNGRLAPSSASKTQTEESNTADSLSIPVTESSEAEAHMGAGLSVEMICPKREIEDPKSQEHSDNLEDVRHLSRRKHTCGLCGKSFVYMSHLKDHVNGVHEKIRAYSCELCTKSFRKKADLKIHIDGFHKQLRKYTCDICCKTFRERRTVKTHIDSVHKRLRVYSCETCGKAFVDRGHLRNHIHDIHKQLREFTCEICDKSFARKGSLTSHVDVIHKQLREYACELCGKAFAARGHLTKHIDGFHKQLRKYACELCGKAFAQNCQLKRHIDSVHKEIRRYTCEICGRAFKENGTMKKHIDIVHKELREYSCGFCGKAFSRNFCLKTHIDLVHKDSAED
nr:unnamed protein product [Spirometra erinaceieuropaei]